MCGCVPGELLRQYSAAKSADISCVPSIRSLWRSFTYAQCHDCTDFIFPVVDLGGSSLGSTEPLFQSAVE